MPGTSARVYARALTVRVDVRPPGLGADDDGGDGVEVRHGVARLVVLQDERALGEGLQHREVCRPLLRVDRGGRFIDALC